jgi:hypothetical protein
MAFVSVFDVISVILIVLFSVRKLDVQGRRVEEFPGVAPDAFDAWQTWEVSAYRLGIWACFLKLVLGQVFAWFVLPGLPQTMMRNIPGAAIDLSWAVAMVVSFWRRSQARTMRRNLGIDLNKSPNAPPPAEK